MNLFTFNSVCATTENRRDGNEYLKKLNDRLSSYIYRLRQFEKENNKEEVNRAKYCVF